MLIPHRRQRPPPMRSTEPCRPPVCRRSFRPFKRPKRCSPATPTERLSRNQRRRVRWSATHFSPVTTTRRRYTPASPLLSKDIEAQVSTYGTIRSRPRGGYAEYAATICTWPATPPACWQKSSAKLSASDKAALKAGSRASSRSRHSLHPDLGEGRRRLGAVGWGPWWGGSGSSSSVGERIGKQHLTYGQWSVGRAGAGCAGPSWGPSCMALPVSTTHILSSRGGRHDGGERFRSAMEHGALDRFGLGPDASRRHSAGGIDLLRPAAHFLNIAHSPVPREAAAL